MSERSEVTRHQAVHGYVDVDRITNSDGIVVVISQRRKTGALTFTVFREYEDALDGERKRTGFLPESLFQSYLDTLAVAKKRMQDLHASGTLPFPVRRSNADRS